MNGAQVFPFPKTPRMYACVHVHVSGRRCKRRVRDFQTRCQGCLPEINSKGWCPECRSMAEAFGVKVPQ